MCRQLPHPARRIAIRLLPAIALSRRASIFSNAIRTRSFLVRPNPPTYSPDSSINCSLAGCHNPHLHSGRTRCGSSAQLFDSCDRPASYNFQSECSAMNNWHSTLANFALALRAEFAALDFEQVCMAVT